MTSDAAIISAALDDPAEHRQLFDFPDDRTELRPPQVEIVNRVERAIEDREAETICIRCSRQTGKNEAWAMIATRFLDRYRKRGGTYLRTAPTWPTLFANSQRRLEAHLTANPLADYRRTHTYPTLYESGAACVILYSADKTAEVVGATADRALDMDEAHKTDPTKFNEDFHPMTASTAAPTILWGVAGNRTDLLFDERQRLLNSGRVDCALDFPYEIWCDLMPAYAKFIEAEIGRLGDSHPIFLTQYALKDVDTLGGFFSEKQQATLFESDHGRVYSPRDANHLAYYIVVDFAGADEEERDDATVREEKPGQDSTAALVIEADLSDVHHYLGVPKCRIIDFLWFTGRPLPEQEREIIGWIEQWHPDGGVADAAGLGEQLSWQIAARWPQIIPYSATAKTVHEDCSRTLAMLNHGLIRAPYDDGSQEWAEFKRQIGWSARRFNVGQRMKICKPGADARGHGGDPTRHIDFAKCLTYISRALFDSVTEVTEVEWLSGGSE